MNSFDSFKKWWYSNVCTFEDKTNELICTFEDGTKKLIESLYSTAVPLLLCKRSKMFVNLDMKKYIQQELEQQSFLKQQVENFYEKIKSELDKSRSKLLDAKARIKSSTQNFQIIESHLQKALEHIKKAKETISSSCINRIVPTDKTSVLRRFWEYMTS